MKENFALASTLKTGNNFYFQKFSVYRVKVFKYFKGSFEELNIAEVPVYYSPIIGFVKKNELFTVFYYVVMCYGVVKCYCVVMC